MGQVLCHITPLGTKGLEHWDLGVHEVLEPAHRKYPELTVCWRVSLIF